MREQEITCLSPSWIITDLAQSLVRGDRLILSEEQAHGSADLEFAIRSGAVSARWLQRCRNVNRGKPKPFPPTYTPPYVQRMGGVPPPQREEVEIRVDPPTLRAVVREVVQEVVREEFQQIRNLLDSMRVRVVRENVPADADAPLEDRPASVFIPSIAKPGKVDLNVETAATQADNLEGAAAALKAAKKEK